MNKITILGNVSKYFLSYLLTVFITIFLPLIASLNSIEAFYFGWKFSSFLSQTISLLFSFATTFLFYTIGNDLLRSSSYGIVNFFSLTFLATMVGSVIGAMTRNLGELIQAHDYVKHELSLLNIIINCSFQSLLGSIFALTNVSLWKNAKNNRIKSWIAFLIVFIPATITLTSSAFTLLMPTSTQMKLAFAAPLLYTLTYIKIYCNSNKIKN